MLPQVWFSVERQRQKIERMVDGSGWSKFRNFDQTHNAKVLKNKRTRPDTCKKITDVSYMI